MKKVLLGLALMVSMSAHAGMAFYTGEYISGMNKVCLYDYLGSTYTRNVKSYALCPMSISV